jgi:hypothetical protein
MDTQQAHAHGLAEAQRCAQSNGPDWTEVALNALDHYAQLATTPFTIEEAREWIGDLVPQPKDDRAWGSVAARAVRLNHIKAVGYAPARSSHGSIKRTYVWVR